MFAELLNVLPIDGLGKAERGVDDVGVETKEVLRNLRCAGIFAVEGSYEGGGLTLVVDLVVDAALGEHGALEFGERAGDFGVLTSRHQAVLENVAKIDLAFDDGEKFGGAGMDMGCVDATSVKEAKRGGNSQTSEDGESLNVLVSQLVRNDQRMERYSRLPWWLHPWHLWQV